MTNVEIVDLPFLIKNETEYREQMIANQKKKKSAKENDKARIGPYDEANTEFLHM